MERLALPSVPSCPSRGVAYGAVAIIYEWLSWAQVEAPSMQELVNCVGKLFRAGHGSYMSLVLRAPTSDGNY